MAISFKVLGGPLEDNAVLATVDTGQQVSRLLFDCGEGTLAAVPFGETLVLDHVFFSHFHMDHICGFDTFFRRHFDRTERPNHLWGPPGTVEVLRHRFLGFIWNLVEEKCVPWWCHDIFPDHVKTVRYELGELFAFTHPEPNCATPDRIIIKDPGYQVEALTLNHGIPSIGYLVREPERWNIDPLKLEQLGMKPGPWLNTLQGPAAQRPEGIEVGGKSWRVEELRDLLYVRTPGDSFAYLTDFSVDVGETERIAEQIRGVRQLVCECQYREKDAALAARNHHMTTRTVGTLAAAAGAHQLCLVHLSDRYDSTEWRPILAEVAAIFPAASYPESWGLVPC